MKNIKEKTNELKRFLEKYPLSIAVGYFFIYFPVFTLLERYRQPEYYVHCWLDDVLPFCEYFIIPYVMWFAFVPGMLFFFLKTNKDAYIRCCKVIFGGMTFCLFVYWLFPTGLTLREPILNRNFCCYLVNLIRSADTPTNVCPSIHVSSTIGILLVLYRSESYRSYKTLKVLMGILGAAICIATVLLDQHSVIDVVCGFMLSFVLDGVTESEAEQTVQTVQTAYKRSGIKIS